MGKDGSGGASSNQPDMLDETGAAKSVELAAPLLAALRAKAREYDSVEPSANGSRGAVASASRGQGGSSGAVGAAAGGASGGAQQAYGMSQKISRWLLASWSRSEKAWWSLPACQVEY